MFAKAVRGDEAALDLLLGPLVLEAQGEYAHNVAVFTRALELAAHAPPAKRVLAKRFALLAMLSQPHTWRDPVVRLRALCPNLDERHTRAFLNAIRPETLRLGRHGVDLEVYVRRCVRCFDVT